MIYIIKELCKDNYKIGITKNLKRRLTQLQCGNPDILLINCCYTTTNDRLYEKHLHSISEKFNIRNEWFKFDKEEINNLKVYITTLENISNDYEL